MGGLTGFLNGIGENRSFCLSDSLLSIRWTDRSRGAFAGSVRGEAGVGALSRLREGDEGDDLVRGRGECGGVCGRVLMAAGIQAEWRIALDLREVLATGIALRRTRSGEVVREDM